MGIPFPIDVLDDAEDAFLRVDGPQGAVLGDPQLGQVVANEVGTDHGGGGLPAAAGRSTRKEREPSFRTAQAGDEHVLGDLPAPPVVGGQIDGEAVIAFLQEQGVSGVGAEHAVGRQPAAVHEHPGQRQVLASVRPLAVHVGEEHPSALDLPIEALVSVEEQEVGAVHDVRRTGDFQRGDRRCRAKGSPAVKPDQHGLAAHDPAHVQLHVLMGLGAQQMPGQYADLVAGVDDVIGTVDDAPLLVRQVEVNGVVLHRELPLFILLEAQSADPAEVFGRAAVDEYPVGPAHGDGIGDLEQRLLAGDRRDLGQVRGVHGPLEHRPGFARGAYASDLGKDVASLLEFQHGLRSPP